MKIRWWETIGHVKYVEKHFTVKDFEVSHRFFSLNSNLSLYKIPKTFKRKDVIRIHLEKHRSKHFGERVKISKNKRNRATKAKKRFLSEGFSPKTARKRASNVFNITVVAICHSMEVFH